MNASLQSMSMPSMPCLQVTAIWFPAAVQAEFQLGNVEDGLLPSAFLAGLLIASIVYSELTTRYNAFRMIGKSKI